MQHFECDYMEGAHPQILKRLIETNMEKTPGYGMDARMAKCILWLGELRQIRRLLRQF